MAKQQREFARPHKGNLHGMYKFCSYTVVPFIEAIANVRWDGVKNFPQDGPFIVAPTHMSDLDPLSMGYFVGINGYELRFLAKDNLFKIPVVGSFFRWWGMIPVARGSSEATDALVHAREALAKGAVVGIYFEGTLTRDPALWPMRGKTGLARLALDTRVPVIPVVQWGVQDVKERYGSFKIWGKRPTMYFQVLPPLDYSDIEGDSSNREGVRELTSRLQKVLEEGSAQLRGEVAPQKPWDMKDHDGPDKALLKPFARWRRSLARAAKVPDILPADPSLTRDFVPTLGDRARGAQTTL